MSKKKAYVIGNNVSTSLSPTIFQYWFKKYNINAEYRHVEIKEENFNQKIKLIIKEEGLAGFNVTIPYKEKILPFLDGLDDVSKKLGAVNCVTKENNSLFGTNTDGYGFNAALFAKEPEINKDRYDTVVIIGFGGAAKSIINSLSAKRIYVFNRSYEKIWEASKELGFYPMKIEFLENVFNGQPVNIVFPSRSLVDMGKPTKDPDTKYIFPDLIVNTTPANVLKNMKIKKFQENPFFEKIPNTVGFDIVYRPRKTEFLSYFNPALTIEGVDMLVRQAAPCFNRWFNVDPEADGIDNGLFNLLYNKLEENK